MTTTNGMTNVEYAGIKAGDMMRAPEYGFAGKVVQFSFEQGDVYCVVEDSDGKRHAALLECLEFYTPDSVDQEPDSDDPNVQYVHLRGEEAWSADCPACLRRLAHSDNEHYADLNRVHEASNYEG
jgi:hypothetical protein